MLSNQQGTLSPIRLSSDASSEGLPSPETLRNLLFSEHPLSQPRTPIRNTPANAEVIVLDDTPPVVERNSQQLIISEHDDLSDLWDMESSTPTTASNIDSTLRPTLSERLESIAESVVENVTENAAGSRKKGKRKMEADGAASQKELARLQKKRDREMAKAHKEAEKKRLKDLKEVNAIRTVSTDTLDGMTICIEKSLYDSELGEAIKTQFEGKEAEIIRSDEEFESIIRWETKTRAEWDSLSQSFLPFSNGEIRVISNKHVAVWMDMPRLTSLILSNELIPRLKQIQSRQSEAQIVLLIEGLRKYYRDRRNIQSRKFQQRVLQGIAQENGEPQNGKMASASSSKKPRVNKTDWIANGLDQNEVEDIMLSLQLEHKVMIINTVDCSASASWILSLSANIATKTSPTDLLDFCTEGRSRSGVDATDTWLKMLQNIQKCTDAVAKAIVHEYPTFYTLYEAYTRCQSIEEAEMLLAPIQVEQSALSERDRYINKAMSKKIHNIIMSEDNKLVIS